MKSHSSKWIKTKDESLKDFYWQDGYGAFSVNPERLDRVIYYINKQREHHNVKSFKEEYIGLLKENRTEFDEHYVWE